MTENTEIIRQRLFKTENYLGDFDPDKQGGYDQLDQCSLFGCVWESKIDDNENAPAVWDGGDTITPNTQDWKQVSGDYEAWLMNKDKPAQSVEYPFNGMGRVKLKKHLVEVEVDGHTVTKNLLTQDMFEDGEGNPFENTVFVIQYDFTLGEDITVPANCVLEFDGGSLTASGNNDTITGTNTIIDGLIKLSNIKFDGTFSNTTLDITNEFGNNVDWFGILQCFVATKINLYRDIVITTKDTRLLPSVTIDGRGNTIKVVCMCFGSTSDVTLKNIVFDCSIAEKSLIHNENREGGFIDILGNTYNNISIVDCDFIQMTDDCMNYLRDTGNILVSGCHFQGTLTSSSTASNSSALFLYKVFHSAVVENCTFDHVNGYGIHFEQGDGYKDTILNVHNNKFDTLTHGAVVADGGVVRNLTISNNYIYNNAYLGYQIAEDSSINIHGFDNVIICGNYIDAPNCHCFNIDGEDAETPSIIAKGDGCIITNNTVKNSSAISLGCIKNVTIKDCNITLNGQCLGMWGTNIQIINNIFSFTASSGSYPINLRHPAEHSAIDYLITIDGNIIEVTGGNVWIDDGNASGGNNKITIGKNSIRNNVNDKSLYNIYRSTSTIHFLYKKELHCKFNPSKVQRIPLSAYGQTIVGMKIFTFENTAISESAMSLSFGLFGTDSINDTVLGSFSLPTGIYHRVYDVDINNSYPPSPCYLYNPGGGYDNDIDVVFYLVDYQKYR